VSGKNLLGVCKLVFKVSRCDRNDRLFLEDNILGKLPVAQVGFSVHSIVHSVTSVLGILCGRCGQNVVCESHVAQLKHCVTE
jgi:hypothetical protein